MLWTGKQNPTPLYESEYVYSGDWPGRLESKTDFKGQAVTFEYDEVGRLERKTWYNASPTPTPVLELEYAYDAYGQVQYIDVDTCGGGCGETIYYDYDDLGRVTSRTGLIDDIEYDYDAAGRLVDLTFPEDDSNDFVRRWDYDRASRVVAVREGSADPIVQYGYNLASQRTRADFENLAYSRWVYDDTFGHLDTVTHYDLDDGVLASFEYDYDLDGLREKVTREDGGYVEYDYDGLSRLTDEHAKNSGGTTQWRRQYTYDKVGNRTFLTKTDGATTLNYHYYYTGLGQLYVAGWTISGQGGEYHWTYTYDANGNMITREKDFEGSVSESWTHEWDAQDRMVSAVKDDQTGADEDLKVEYRYCQTCGGALSERIEYDDDSGGDIVSWLRYEYDGLNLLRIDEKYDDEANGLDEDDPWRRMNVFVHGPGAIGQIVKCEWYRYEADGSPPDICCDTGYYYYFYDAVGNVVGVLDEDHQFFRWEMDAFGNDLPGANDFLPMDQPGPKEHLTGKMFDTATGLYYFAARWYDPEVGRFVSRDLVPRGNLYAFVRNNPLYYGDPNGKWEEDLSAIIENWEICEEFVNGLFNEQGQLQPGDFPLPDQINDDPRNAGNHAGHCYACCMAGACAGSFGFLGAVIAQLMHDQPSFNMDPDARIDQCACFRGAIVGNLWQPLVSLGIVDPQKKCIKFCLKSNFPEYCPHCQGENN